MYNWSKETITGEIQRLHREGADLNYAGAVESHVALLRAATRYFGSWRSAVECSGIDYSSVRVYKSWTRERIIKRIRELHAQGVDLSWRNMTTNVDPQLAAAAAKSKHFGSWQNAIAAAGLDYFAIRRYQKWTPEVIIQRVRELHAQGVDLNAKNIEEHDVTLITAARRRFESWDRALTAAGLDYRQIVLRAPFQRRSRAASNGTGHAANGVVDGAVPATATTH